MTLVQDVVEDFIEDPLPALFEMNPADTSGLDVLYSGARVETTVGGPFADAWRRSLTIRSFVRRPCAYSALQLIPLGTYLLLC